jgi:hypothetical protein
MEKFCTNFYLKTGLGFVFLQFLQTRPVTLIHADEGICDIFIAESATVSRNRVRAVVVVAVVFDVVVVAVFDVVIAVVVVVIFILLLFLSVLVLLFLL